MKSAREVEVEVLPKDGDVPIRPGASGKPGLDDPFIALVSRLMDSVFTLPGTNIRFGLDPILGLLPGFGDTLASFVSIILIAQSARHGVPRIVIARMAMNVVINAGIGSIPVLGDAFSFWFKSNNRNYELLSKHAGTRKRTSTFGDWLFVAGLLTAMVLVITLLVVGAATLLGALFRSAQPS